MVLRGNPEFRQNSDKAASFSAVVVNKNIASSVWKSTTVNHFAITSRCLNTMKSLLTFKIISGIFFWNLAKHPVHDSDFVLLYIHRLARWIFNNYSLKSRWSNYSPRFQRIIVWAYTHELISTKSDRKPLKGTIWLTDQITRKFKNRSLQNFQTWQFTSLSLRKQQHYQA